MPPANGAERREQILAAAMELFKANGFASVSTRDLADHAGLSRSHVYHYFPDWKSLRREAFERFVAEQVAETEALYAGQRAPKALKSFLRHYLPKENDRDWSMWMGAWVEALREPELAATFHQGARHWETVLEKIIRQGVEEGEWTCAHPARAARQLVALLNGYADNMLVHGGTLPSVQPLPEIMEVARLVLPPL
ncbi:TetR/AcrR family transcriptional regulator [Pseudoduganella violacea]|uniref:AcrR family transcriptional regulator n=1 Tax=Pseudoduganella violacea TaxID=1715466 RepID=A0A7W5BFB1_9BURK|nr:TetR/AcrR family transcriptional regulator [Pseudoduganella violacea]MBB3122127.1 AcrR family transcriptional regulator [Pseudoduganella violacea]